MAVREFNTGATQDSDDGKLDFEGFLFPLALRRFAEYMHENRVQADGSVRDSDNWQKGIPLDAYMKSGWRHFFDQWLHHRGLGHLAGADLERTLCAVIFNAQGYLHEVLAAKGSTLETRDPMSGPGAVLKEGDSCLCPYDSCLCPYDSCLCPYIVECAEGECSTRSGRFRVTPKRPPGAELLERGR